MKLRRWSTFNALTYSVCVGSALASLACSDPVPAKPQGAFRVSFGTTSDRPDDTQCPNQLSAALPTEGQPSTTNPGQRIVDGAGGANVECQIKRLDDVNFRVQVRIAKGNTSFFFRADSVSSADDGSGTPIGGEGLVATNFQEFSLESNLDSFGDEYNRSCKVVPIVANGEPQIGAGKIWASFTCPGIGETPATYCKADVPPGVFVFERCAE